MYKIPTMTTLNSGDLALSAKRFACSDDGWISMSLLMDLLLIRKKDPISSSRPLSQLYCWKHQGGRQLGTKLHLYWCRLWMVSFLSYLHISCLIELIVNLTTSATQRETVSSFLGSKVFPMIHHAKMVTSIGMRGLRIGWFPIRVVRATIDLIVERRTNVQVSSPRELYSGFSCFYCRSDYLLW